MNAQASISLDHVDKILGKAKRVDDLSLELAAGKIYGLLGPNGSGKTTILHLICGLYKPDRGTIRVLGMDPVRDHKAVRSAIGLLPQSAALVLAAVVSLAVALGVYSRWTRGEEGR